MHFRPRLIICFLPSAIRYGAKSCSLKKYLLNSCNITFSPYLVSKPGKRPAKSQQQHFYKVEVPARDSRARHRAKNGGKKGWIARVFIRPGFFSTLSKGGLQSSIFCPFSPCQFFASSPRKCYVALFHLWIVGPSSTCSDMRAKKSGSFLCLSTLFSTARLFTAVLRSSTTDGRRFFATIPFDFASASSELLSRKLFLAVSNWFPVGKVIGLSRRVKIICCSCCCSFSSLQIRDDHSDNNTVTGD